MSACALKALTLSLPFSALTWVACRDVLSCPSLHASLTTLALTLPVMAWRFKVLLAQRGPLWRASQLDALAQAHGALECALSRLNEQSEADALTRRRALSALRGLPVRLHRTSAFAQPWRALGLTCALLTLLMSALPKRSDDLGDSTARVSPLNKLVAPRPTRPTQAKQTSAQEPSASTRRGAQTGSQMGAQTGSQMGAQTQAPPKKLGRDPQAEERRPSTQAQPRTDEGARSRGSAQGPSNAPHPQGEKDAHAQSPNKQQGSKQSDKSEQGVRVNSGVGQGGAGVSSEEARRSLKRFTLSQSPARSSAQAHAPSNVTLKSSSPESIRAPSPVISAPLPPQSAQRLSQDERALQEELREKLQEALLKSAPQEPTSEVSP